MKQASLLEMSHALGREDRELAIVGEGNTSARLSAEKFVVKASGSNLATLSAKGLTVCRFQQILPLLTKGELSDNAVDGALLGARVDPNAGKPSVEAIFHAYLLTLPGVEFVGHTHPTAVNQLLCSEHARTLARRRIFPDEVVCCGKESVFVPYADPGLKLAQAILVGVRNFMRRHTHVPRVILLQGHGLIALGAKPEAVLAATLMGDKAARVFVGAASVGSPRFLTASQVDRIAGRTDEHYRQRILGL